ncbi:MAG: ATP-binding protein [Chloroflexota bacterium]
MKEFVGRKPELAALRSELNLVRETGVGRFVWVRGRRRVGKSRLVQEFCDRSRTRYCFYQAPQRAKSEALGEFVTSVRESTLAAAADFDGVVFDSWPTALRSAARGAAGAKPAIVVIDELPYLAEEDPGFAADLQKAWDRSLEKSAVLLVCVGSDVRMMEALVAERSPLHGRPTREVVVAPLNPADVARITGAASASDAFDRHLIVGGFPLLAASWPQSAGVRRFLETALADDQTPFATTALRIMSSELAGELQARKVIEAIGRGESAYGRIQQRSGVKGNTLTEALTVLIEKKRLVVRELPYGVPPGRKAAKYSVLDPYLRFWLRFVGPHMAELSRGRSDLVVKRALAGWHAYRGRAIEPLVREALERLLAAGLDERLGGARHVGGWWRRDHAVEVDLVGGDALEPSRIGFIGSVKWRERKPFSPAELDDLARCRSDVPGGATAKLVAVSRTGIAGDVEADAVFGPDDLLNAW